MTVRSGRLGVVNAHNTVLQWSINQTSDNKATATSNSEQGTLRRKGNRDWNGSFTQLLALPTIMPSDKFTFSGFANDEDGSGSADYSGDAIVDSVAITWNWATAEIIQTVVNFSGDGKVTTGTAEGEDLVVPDPPSSICTKIEWAAAGAAPVYAEWEDLATATLTISAANQPYVNSSSCEQVGGKWYAWNKRRPGKIDWNLAITEQNSDGLIDDRLIQDDITLRIYTDDTDFWLLTDGQIQEATGLVFNRDTGAIVQRTVPVAMQAFRPGASAAGLIAKPGGAQWWPFS